MDAVKSDDYIQLAKDTDILRLGIRDSEGNDTGEWLEFNLEDIELPLRYQEILEKDKQNRLELKNKLLIIDKKQDHKGKKLMSSNQEAKIKAFNEFYRKEEQVYNMFLGENGVKKLLNGKALSWTSLEVIGEIIEKQIMPHIQVRAEDIMNKIKEKYGDKRNDIIE